MGRMPDLSNMQKIGFTGQSYVWLISGFLNPLNGGNSVIAAQEELASPRVMSVVDDLVTKEASGVLAVAGNPSGAIYLDGGRIAYARASWVPGLAVRLRAIVPSLTGSGEPWPGEDADDAAVAALAVRHGYLTTAELREFIGSVIVEAFLVLTIPLAADSLVGAVRFTPAATRWTDLFPRLGIDVVRGEAASRAESMAACGLAPTTAVAPRDLAAPSAVLTPEQWAVACQIGDRVSARELALRRGASLSDTVHCLGSLVRAGLCVPVQPVRRGQHQARRRPASSAPYGPAPSASYAPYGPALSASYAPYGPAWPAPATPAEPALAVPSEPALATPAEPALAVSAEPAPAAPSEPARSAASEPAASSPPATRPTVPPPAPPPAATSPGFPATERLQVRPARESVWGLVRPAQPPSVELLRQVLNGLRRL